MSSATRELSITYGSLAVGGSDTTRQITDYIISQRQFESFSCEFTFVIVQSTEATFATEIAAVELAFRTPFQNLTITQGSSNLYAFSQTSSTGFDAQPEILKRGSPADTGRSRTYTVRITLGLPASTGAELQVGLREHSVNVLYSPERRRTVTINGLYTANGSTNAYAQYNATIDALATSVASALSITAANFEKVDEPVNDWSYNTKTMRFSRIYRELIFSQGGAANDDSGIVDQSLIIERQRIAPGDSGSEIKRLQTLTVTYSAHIDKTVTTDLKTKYYAIRAWMLSQVSAFAPGILMLTDERPNINYDENTLGAHMTVLVSSGAVAISYTKQTQDQKLHGKVLVPVWNGDKYAKYKFQGPATFRRTITETTRIFANSSRADEILAKGGEEVLGDNFIHESSTPFVLPLTIGLDGYQAEVMDVIIVQTYLGYNPYKGGGGGDPQITTPGSTKVA